MRGKHFSKGESRAERLAALSTVVHSSTCNKLGQERPRVFLKVNLKFLSAEAVNVVS